MFYIYAVGCLWCAGVAAFLFVLLMKSIINDFGKEPFLKLAFYAVSLCGPLFFMALYFSGMAAMLVFW